MGFNIVTKIKTLYMKRDKSIMFSITCLFYNILQLLCGFDFGFYRFKASKARFVVKLLTLMICVTLAAISLVIHFLGYDPKYFWISFAFALFFMKYLMTAFYLIYLSADKSLGSFHYELHAIDSKIGVDPASFYVEVKMLLTSALFMFHRLFHIVSFCITGDFCIKPTIVLVIYIETFVSTDMLIILYSYIFYAASCRLKKLVSILEKTESDFLSIQFIYKLYVDHAEKFKDTYDPLIIVTLLWKIPELMDSIYNTIKNMLEQNSSLSVAVNSENAMNLQALIITFAPAVFAGMLSTHADRIRLVLHEKALIEKDPVKVREIERFIRYVEARGCRFRLFKLIPFDVNLLTMTLGFMVTYLVIIIQLTHVY